MRPSIPGFNWYTQTPERRITPLKSERSRDPLGQPLYPFLEAVQALLDAL